MEARILASLRVLVAGRGELRRAEVTRPFFMNWLRGESRTYAAIEKRSASLSQSATRFHLGKIWSTTLRSRLPRERELWVASHAKGVHRSGAA